MPVETLTDRLTGSFRSWFGWSRIKTQEIGTVVNEDRDSATYNIAPGTGAGQADLAYGVTRTVPANSADEFDLRDLEETTLGVTVPFRFRRIRLLRLVNRSTTAGRRLFVGADPGNPTTRYAADVGPGSEWTAVNHIDGWEVTTANSIVRVANPNAASVAYDLYAIGVAITVPGKPVISLAGDAFGDSMTVVFLPPSDNGGSEITSYKFYLDGVETAADVGPADASSLYPAEPAGSLYAGINGNFAGQSVEVSAVNAIGEGERSEPEEVT